MATPLTTGFVFLVLILPAEEDRHFALNSHMVPYNISLAGERATR